MEICFKCSRDFSLTEIVKVVDYFYCEKCIGSLQFNILALNKFEDFDYELSKKNLSRLTREVSELTAKIKLYENTFGISPVYMTCFPRDKECKSYLIFQYLNSKNINLYRTFCHYVYKGNEIVGVVQYDIGSENTDIYSDLCEKEKRTYRQIHYLNLHGDPEYVKNILKKLIDKYYNCGCFMRIQNPPEEYYKILKDFDFRTTTSESDSESSDSDSDRDNCKVFTLIN